MLFDNLTARDPDLNLKPGLATEWNNVLREDLGI